MVNEIIQWSQTLSPGQKIWLGVAVFVAFVLLWKATGWIGKVLWKGTRDFIWPWLAKFWIGVLLFVFAIGLFIGVVCLGRAIDKQRRERKIRREIAKIAKVATPPIPKMKVGTPVMVMNLASNRCGKLGIVVAHTSDDVAVRFSDMYATKTDHNPYILFRRDELKVLKAEELGMKLLWEWRDFDN